MRNRSACAGMIALIAVMAGCSNHYVNVRAAPASEARLSAAVKERAVGIARAVAQRHGLREVQLEDYGSTLLADFGDGSVWLQVWWPDGRSLEYSIGEHAWSESERTRQIREDLEAGLAEELPGLEVSVSGRRDVMPFGP